MAKKQSGLQPLEKTPTGINGFDEITFGGLPKGRPTLITGHAGSGKTVMAMNFLVHGATEFDEPGVFVAFEETDKDLAANFASFGYDLEKLEAEKKIALEYVYIERSEIEETGEYDLEALFIRLGAAIDSIGAKRVVLDTIEVLFSGLSNFAILRAELRRLFRFLKEKGVTAIVTGERGEDTLTRYGLEEYVADCVIVLDHRMEGQIATRRLRILKYRGSAHATNEFPFIISSEGVSVLPITSIGLQHTASDERVPTGIAGLDEMMDGKGYYRASSIFITGTAGTGKTTIAAAFVEAACERGEKALYFSFEESPDQLMRNMQSVGIDLRRWATSGRLVVHSVRPTQHGIETHLTMVTRLITQHDPAVVVLDPISNLVRSGGSDDAKAMLTRLIDYLKTRGITSIFTSLSGGEYYSELRELGLSSLMDTWINVRNLETNGERNRGLYVLKSRGMSHSNRIREFLLTDEGIQLIEACIGPEGLLAGTARELQQARDGEAAVARERENGNIARSVEQKHRLLEARIAAMRAEFKAEELEAKQRIAQGDLQASDLVDKRKRISTGGKRTGGQK